MKLTYLTFMFAMFIATSFGQGKFITKNGTVTFFSSAPMEDITADNKQVLSIIDTSTGEMAISILMKSFLFEKSLMREHFNENYVESDKFPKAIFKGKTLDFKAMSNGSKKVEIEGTLEIHGVTKNIKIHADVTKTDEGIVLKGEFFVKVSDYKIKIPAIVVNNIGKKIKVSFELNHTPYKQ